MQKYWPVVGMIDGMWGDWLLELPINTYRMAIAENGDTVAYFECQPEECVCCLYLWKKI